MRYRITVSYDGSKFHGFQRLKDYSTVQSELERSLNLIFRTNILIKGASRTDRGVHALKQYCHFDLEHDIEEYKIISALNHTTNHYLHILNCQKVTDKFHSRFSVQKKIYTYKINLGAYDAVREDYLLNYNHQLDIRRMRVFSKKLLGNHDFRYFVSGKRENCVSTIYKITFIKKKNMLEIEFVGTTFYKYMIRNLIGFLIEVGRGNYNLEDLEYIYINEYKIVKYTCAPPNGLYLKEIVYESVYE